MLTGQNGDRVSADFVGRIPIGSDAVRPHHHMGYLSPAQIESGHAVGNDFYRNAVTLQLPSRQPGPLEQGARLVGQNPQPPVSRER